AGTAASITGCEFFSRASALPLPEQAQSSRSGETSEVECREHESTALDPPEPSRVAGGRALRRNQGGGDRRRRSPGDIRRKGLPVAARPVRQRAGRRTLVPETSIAAWKLPASYGFAFNVSGCHPEGSGEGRSLPAVEMTIVLCV